MIANDTHRLGLIFCQNYFTFPLGYQKNIIFLTFNLLYCNMFVFLVITLILIHFVWSYVCGRCTQPAWFTNHLSTYKGGGLINIIANGNNSKIIKCRVLIPVRYILPYSYLSSNKVSNEYLKQRWSKVFNNALL
jgi:hypothetical protein